MIIKRIERNKRKHVTSVFGLDLFSKRSGGLNPTGKASPLTLLLCSDVDLKKAAKLFANRYACGSSVTKNNQSKDEIVVQGDVTDEIRELILATWPAVSNYGCRGIFAR